MHDDLISRAWFKLRDWVYDNYRTAFVAGTGYLAYLITFPSPQWGLLLWCLALLAGMLLDPCVDPVNQKYGAQLVKGPETSPPRIALTFDDGPSPPVTERLLDLLKREGVRATFFLIGERAARHPETVRRIAAEGHLIGNHTQTHANLLLLPPSAGRQEIENGSRSIAAALGEPPRWFRVPKGFRYPWNLRDARRIGQEPVSWSINPRDFQDPGVETILSRTLDQVHPGAILLLHDGPENREQTLEAVTRLIPELRSRGYQLVGIDQL